ncbi:hypothetical protein BWQ96_01926 [Gracilariopsis chorda]|uniref:L-2-amino-thiazoline-4-carboxylic acid hydrolase n=1 Tax=Gracilariopsis chorda TaxID=448386 RepID=A0A2V3J2L2_9FLOR|nr:hypothetical protein BWQ96_01926 [Gracilariopsis chorda]|eukprot:PXF48237.1 hypothetical protein BWQ96_01926 [Gracilariopsis chorda]
MRCSSIFRDVIYRTSFLARGVNLGKPPHQRAAYFYRSLTQAHLQATQSPDDIMNMSSNRATRFVYLRTLPLVKQPELQDEVDAIAKSIEDGTQKLCAKYIETVTDDRAAVHLHTTALAIATHRVLSPRIKNEIRLCNIIRSGFGAVPVPDRNVSDEERKAVESGGKTRPDFWIVRAALWFSFDRMAAVRRMTANMMRDFGSTFETSTEDDEIDEQSRHNFFVKKCYYNELCRAEDVPHLTKIFCALDKAIYSPITADSHGISFTLDKTLADQSMHESNERCEFRFVQHK